MPRCTNCNDTGWLRVGQVPERCEECQMMTNPSQDALTANEQSQAVEREAAVPGGVTLEAIEAEFDKAVEYVPTGWRETYPALRSRSLSEIRQAIRALFAAPSPGASVTASPAAETAPDAGLVEAHSCPACPVEVRDLAACAHNAYHAVEMAFDGHGDWGRARRKLADLKGSLDRFQPISDAHFAALARAGERT